MSGATRKARGLSSQRGFTLIELLVVVAIIGLLSSVILAALGSSRDKANNAKIIAEVKQYDSALNLYSSSNGNTYPLVQSENGNWACLGNYETVGSCYGGSTSYVDSNLDSLLNAFIPGPPQFPAAGAIAGPAVYECNPPLKKSTYCGGYVIRYQLYGQNQTCLPIPSGGPNNPNSLSNLVNGDLNGNTVCNFIPF